MVGALLSAFILALANGLMGPMVDTAPVIRSGGFGLGALFVAASAVSPSRVPRPQNKRQVSDAVVFATPRRGAAQFGFEMGTGVRTYVTTDAPYLLAIFLLFGDQSIWIFVTAALGFGGGRGLTNFVYLWVGEKARGEISLATTASSYVAMGLLIGAWLRLEL